MNTPRFSWFKTILRLWTLRNVDSSPRGAAAFAVLCLSVLWLAAWVAIDWSERQPAPAVSLDGIPLLAWYVLGTLALAALLRGRSAPHASFGESAVLAAGLVPLPLALMTWVASWASPRGFWLACIMAAGYALLYLARGLRSFTGRSHWVTALGGVVFVVGFVIVSDVTNAIPDVWNPSDAAAVASEEDIAARESALFEQSGRIDRALGVVHRDASARPQAFFLGFAGVGDEQVFAQEIGLASRVIGERYHTGERQISLINDERELDGAPLASVAGLDYALHGLAARMKLDRDVLIVAISSHGSQEPAIAVSNSEFPLTDLTPQVLADALNDAGIQWRVIFISACYAGGFIEPLRNAHSIVITAAAADRTSFGCSSDSDLTYFGAALYRDALPEASSLRDAFEKAKLVVAMRERSEGEKPSNPQADFGFDLEQHLAAGHGP